MQTYKLFFKHYHFAFGPAWVAWLFAKIILQIVWRRRVSQTQSF